MFHIKSIAYERFNSEPVPENEPKKTKNNSKEAFVKWFSALAIFCVLLLSLAVVRVSSSEVSNSNHSASAANQHDDESPILATVIHSRRLQSAEIANNGTTTRRQKNTKRKNTTSLAVSKKKALPLTTEVDSKERNTERNGGRNSKGNDAKSLRKKTLARYRSKSKMKLNEIRAKMQQKQQEEHDTVQESKMLHATVTAAGETAHLLERTGDGHTAWRTKARRPSLPQLESAATTTAITTTTTTTTALTPLKSSSATARTLHVMLAKSSASSVPANAADEDDAAITLTPYVAILTTPASTPFWSGHAPSETSVALNIDARQHASNMESANIGEHIYSNDYHVYEPLPQRSLPPPSLELASFQASDAIVHDQQIPRPPRLTANLNRAPSTMGLRRQYMESMSSVMQHNSAPQPPPPPPPPPPQPSSSSTSGRHQNTGDKMQDNAILASATGRNDADADDCEDDDDANGDGDTESSKPVPFHFPYDGPLPQQFKTAENERERGVLSASVATSLAGQHHGSLNNIQDILQQLQLNNGGGGGGSGGGMVTWPGQQPPPLMIMPTGLHIAGSYKNLKSSGILNFFRGKRQNRPIQLTFPVPMSMPLSMQMMGAYQQGGPLMAAALQPYQQRIAIEQLYPFKPRSPHEINLLAMQHHQQQHQQQQYPHQQLHLQQHIVHAARPSSGKKKKKKQQKALTSSAGLFPHQRPPGFIGGLEVMSAGGGSYYLPASNSYVPLMAFNATQKPKLKHIPLKVNLDIYPVLPPSKTIYTPSYALLEESKRPPTRPASMLRHPLTEYYGPMYGSNSASVYEAHGPFKFPSSMAVQQPVSQSSNIKITFPDETATQFLQQQQQQSQQQSQQQNLQPQQTQHYLNIIPRPSSRQPPLTSFVNPADWEPEQKQQANNVANNIPNNVANNIANNVANIVPIQPKPNQQQQLMVHLNVFPRQRSQSSASLHSTNPFYSPNVGAYNLQRQATSTISEEHIPLVDGVEARGATPNQQQQRSLISATSAPPSRQAISRSDTFRIQSAFNDYTDNSVITTADYGVLLPVRRHHSSISSKLDNSDNFVPLYADHLDARSHISYGKPYGGNNSNNNNRDQQALEHFRYPVEDLIKFQMDDAL